jgi:anti-sigma factor ChrR (cupin superfamily)
MIHVAKNQREFTETGIPGIRQCTLWEENGEGAYYSEFKAGAQFPLHDHEGVEQCIIISGRIRSYGVEMTAGDFMKLGVGEVHTVHAMEDTLVLFAHRGGVVMKD